jgi:hypothetical protein
MDLTIGDKTIDKVMRETTELLKSYLRPINSAYMDQDGLTIALQLRFVPHRDGVLAGYQINFVESRIKDSDQLIINERQMELPLNVTNIKK